MSEWMDGYGLLLKALVLSLVSSLSFFSFFLRHGYPYLSFFLSIFLGHASLACHLFSFWGNHNLTLFYFRDVLRERSLRHGEFVNVEWVDGSANFQCRNVANGWVVYVLMIEKE